MADIKTGFPKNLAYNLKKLDAGFTKTKIKILPDKNTVSANDILRFRLTGNGIYDFRSLVLNMNHCSTTCTSAPAVFAHFPRYSSSLIQSISITANNTTLCSINEYGYLYSKLMDFEGGDFSQMSKRWSELYDPSVRFNSVASVKATATTHENAISCLRMADSTTVASNDTGVKMSINNWLGFLNSLSTPCIDLSDIGDLYINIQFAPATVLWKSNTPSGTADIVPTNVNYTLTDNFITIDRITFQSPDYYKLKTEKLIEDGLLIGYYDYYLVSGGLTTKSNNLALNFNINSASLDQLIACYRRSDYNSLKPLVLFGANSVGSADVKTFAEVLADPRFSGSSASALANTQNAGVGDAFNSSVAFVSAANDLTSTMWSVNSIQIDPYALSPIEIYNKGLQYTGFQNIDLGSSGIHPGCLSLAHFQKYYFVDICSLENVSGDNQFWVSGLDGRQGGINIQYTATFNSENASSIYPYIFCRSTKVLSIKAGRQLEIDPPPR
jgi:hypothetical protein